KAVDTLTPLVSIGDEGESEDEEREKMEGERGTEEQRREGWRRGREERRMEERKGSFGCYLFILIWFAQLSNVFMLRVWVCTERRGQHTHTLSDVSPRAAVALSDVSPH